MTLKNKQKIEVAIIVLEIAPGGELYDIIARVGPFNEQITRYYFAQLLNALHYLLSLGLVHRDLKLQNLLLDGNFNLKLADLGFSCPSSGRDESGLCKTLLGTQNYMAPEIL